MASRGRTILLLTGATASVGMIGTVVFVAFGSGAGIWIVGLGVPATIVAGFWAYTRGVVDSTQVRTSDFLAEQARETATDFRMAITVYQRLRDQYDDWDPEVLDTRVETLATDFADAGVRVDPTTGEFEVENPANPRVFDNLGSETDAFVSERDASFREFVAADIRQTNTTLRRLAPEILSETETTAGSPADLPADAGPGTARELLDSARESGKDTVEVAIEQIREAVTEYSQDSGDLDEELAAARSRAAEHDFSGATQQLMRATDVAEEALGGQFEIDRSAVEDLLTTIDQSPMSDYATRDQLDRVDEIRSEMPDIDSAINAERLNETDARLRETAREMVVEIAEELRTTVGQIEDSEIPAMSYTPPGAVETQYRQRFARTETAEEFRQAWTRSVGELTEALDEAQQEAAVASSYGTVAERIETQLRSTGRVTGEELPVSEPRRFMEPYAAQHPDTQYDDSVPVVSMTDGSETYVLTVTARLADHDGTERGFQVGVSGDEYAETVTENEYAITETFSVSYGEYDVDVSVDDDAITDVSRSLRVTSDRQVAIVLDKQPVVDRVCGTDRSAVEAELPAMEDTLRSRFEDSAEGYLTSESELPIADEFVPCLLAVWAESAGYNARMNDGRVLVYDHPAFAERVTFAVENQVVDGGASLSLADIRDRYLTIPASDELLVSTIREAGLPVSVADGEVRSQ